MIDSKARVWPWLLLITLLAALIRLPYWDVIPAAFDEVDQTSYAYQIAHGQIVPLTGNDAYSGPLYVYLVAGLIKLGATDPLVGRWIVLAAGVLTVPVVYAWVLALGRKRLAALIAALFVALNPDLIFVNSHSGGTTLLLPFLTTLFLLCLTLAATRDSPAWLLPTGVFAGLAMQSNMIAALAVAGGLLWFLWQARGKARLGRRWPLWPVVAGIIALLVFSPVIIHAVIDDSGSAAGLETKPYIWEHDPTIATTINNTRRFWLQLGRQTSGVLIGDEKFNALLGVPLLYLALMAAGLVHTTRRISTQPLLVIIPFALVMPVVSSHYGFGVIGRYTMLLVSVWGAVIAFLLAAAIDRTWRLPAGGRRTLSIALLAIMALILIVWPVVSLFRYYRQTDLAGETGRTVLDLSRYPVTHNQDEPVYLSTIEALAAVRGIPYVPHAAFLLGDVYHEFLSPEEIIGRLYENPGPAYFLLNDGDAAVIGATIPIERVPIPANDAAAPRGFGLYRFAGDQPLAKPEFVLDAAPAGLEPNALFGESVQLLG
ncbi:MAG TPA: glycosyltransferase family 39 protein, partial [Promineifilum sp.]|nr:glycosyltransferase family 39 protein [Promineifilum sp.]